MIAEEHRKNFIKLVNYGRVSVMLENQDYCPNWEQLQGYLLIMKKFIYLN